ncbi:lantibiotic dehydratase family protein [Olivibacter sp. XZL3]|uniref:lantibiotic dehydratase family protein n=1 Tax=Olivibacter sp. XZL3 TaxID=1735116 RepID=UPI001416FFBB|nr:lantibiotic dehydratase family protein [Olivibacter sp. XZL3]
MIKAFDFYLLRIPRLPSQVIDRLNECKDEKEAWEYMAELLRNPELLEAIYLSSEDFFESLKEQLASGCGRGKLLTTLYKYISRMAGRATPYGKFSGVSFGKVSGLSTAMIVSGRYSSSYRLDMGFVAQLSKLAVENPISRSGLVYFTNTTVHESADHFTYIEFKEKNNKRFYHWSKIVKNPLLKGVLFYAREGKSYCELVSFLSGRGVAEELAKRYLDQLIEIRLMISELEPTVTGAGATQILTRVKSLGAGSLPVPALLDLDKRLQTINKGNAVATSFKDWNKFNGLAGGKAKSLLQADMLVEMSSNRIDRKTVDALTEELGELVGINKVKTPIDLKAFRRKFSERYGDMEVPLIEVLDPDMGIGYGAGWSGAQNSPLLQGLGTRRKKSNLDDNLYAHIESIMERYGQDSISVMPPITLDDNDIEAMTLRNNDPERSIPVGCYALGNLMYSRESGGDSTAFRLNLLAAGGVSAVPLLTRFCHLDKGLEKGLQECVHWEEGQAEDIIFAEVVYLPESRVGNILTRPGLFKYEIPIIGQAAADAEFTINLDDLWVSIRGGKIVLRSERLNKQIIPRLSSAHNFHYGMVAYRFLCDLQFQHGSLDLSFDWGKLAKRPFLPRVEYKHIILSRARWNIVKNQPKLSRKSDWRSKISLLQEQYELPDRVLIAEGDNELPVDLRNPLGAGIILKQLEKKDIVLYENLWDEFTSPVCGTMGEQYHNEVVLPLKVERVVKYPPYGPRL